MSKYTTQVRFICETAYGDEDSKGFNSVDTILNTVASDIFNFNFPIFDENYRKPLEVKILRHYYTREICEETVGLWKLRLSARLNEIMPYYNKLYESELIDFNPMYDVDITKDSKLEKSGTNTGSSDNSITGDSSLSSKTAFSDTPQGSLENVESLTYLTNATVVDNEGENNSTTEMSYTDNIDTVDDYIEHIRGKSGVDSYSSRLIEFRKTFLNIDMMVINELNDLFFGLW